MNFFFEDRADAGRRLGLTLAELHLSAPVILALPRGGVIVGDEVARILRAPMDVVVARKIAAPGNPEFGIGAISEDEIPHFNSDYLDYLLIDQAIREFLVREESAELRRRVALYRGGARLADLSGRTIVVVDDGLATGVTAEAAGSYLRTLNPGRLILAVPVGPTELGPNLRKSFDQIVCLKSLGDLQSVGKWYRDFEQVEDPEVLEVLRKHRPEGFGGGAVRSEIRAARSGDGHPTDEPRP
jgi:putative phosphoribosyl transferase